jgi:ferredoxin-NADP reductase/Na+-translocating ferredoxin:NAD+ oxidoreductase RnfD subunit
MNSIDAFLNRLTMYRLVLYYLLVLIFAAIILGFFHFLPYSPWAILFSTALAIGACWSLNELLAWFFKAPTNPESTYITACILALLVTPVAWGASPVFLLLACLLAVASKYLLAFKNKHFFNPAAFGVAAASLLGAGAASWWVGSTAMVALVLIGGLLVVRKLQRFDLVLSFIVVATLAIIFTSGFASDILGAGRLIFLDGPILFFAFVMLTEPLTTPPTRRLRMIYGALIGLLFAPGLVFAVCPPWLADLAGFSLLLGTPEFALLLGNLCSFAVSPKGRFMLTLKKIERTSDTTSDFVFESDRRLVFAPGQYMEWTLPHRKSDTRGVRRYFTIASAPTQKEVRLGVKFYDPPSSFKRALSSLTPGALVSASEIRGDFTLPSDPRQKLVFIAGGIGITPFRSMLEYLLDRKESRPIVLFYATRFAADLAYRELLERAQRELNIQVLYAISDERAGSGMLQGPLNRDHVRQYVPDLDACVFYLSGPRSMVVTFQRTLRELSVSRRQIKTDFFPGFV